MKKMFLSTLAIVLFAMSTQAQTIECELLTITHSSKEMSMDNYIQKKVSVTLAVDGEWNEGETKINENTDLRIDEDRTLKGLFQLNLTGGSSPVMSDDGIILSALLKKDEIISNEDLANNFIGAITIPEGKKAQSFALLSADSLSGATQVSMVGKLRKAIMEYNKTAVGNDKVYIQRQMMVQSATSMLERDVVKEILKKNFKDGEMIFQGISAACIEAKK